MSPLSQVMADVLNVHPSKWHEAQAGIPRGDLLKMAAKSLAHSYKLAMKAKVNDV